jgi:hypothetical protein
MFAPFRRSIRVCDSFNPLFTKALSAPYARTISLETGRQHPPDKYNFSTKDAHILISLARHHTKTPSFSLSASSQAFFAIDEFFRPYNVIFVLDFRVSGKTLPAKTSLSLNMPVIFGVMRVKFCLYMVI